MSVSSDPVIRMRRLFDQESCWLIDTLSEELKYSVPSVRRFLSEMGYYSSFTHNAKWYTLSSIPRFNRDGLWFKDQIGFSREGSLTRTLERLASRSPAGMTAEELGLSLRCRCHALLVGLHRKGRLRREKLGRSNVYLSADPAEATSQRLARELRSSPARPLPAEIAVLILADFIRRPNATFEDLAASLARLRHVRVAPELVEKLFEQHGIKKTRGTSEPRLWRR